MLIGHKIHFSMIQTYICKKKREKRGGRGTGRTNIFTLIPTTPKEVMKTNFHRNRELEVSIPSRLQF